MKPFHFVAAFIDKCNISTVIEIAGRRIDERDIGYYQGSIRGSDGGKL